MADTQGTHIAQADPPSSGIGISSTPRRPEHHHLVHRIGWLRAAVLGANDGILSTASLIVGVAAATPDHASILIAGVAALVAGAMSMAAGEYVSVSSQADTERADLEMERRELARAPEEELEELAGIYVDRGVEIGLARQVAAQLMRHDGLGAHARDEIGISETVETRPVQAAMTSAAMFSLGAILPLAAVSAAPVSWVIPVVAGASLISLALLGAVAAHAGGASMVKGAARVTFWGVLAMGATAAIGSAFGRLV